MSGKKVLPNESSLSTSNINTNVGSDILEVIPTSTITIVGTPTKELEISKEPNTTTTDPDIPYSIFSRRKKVLVVIIVSVSSFFSCFSANIYFPALKIIENDMHITERMVSLTVTMYMVLQGISPSFWGSLADCWGRRPVYITTFLIYIIACIGLACTQNYAMLLTLRMIQAFGSSSAVAVGAGTIGDISTPAERGGYLGIYSMGTMLGPLIGPILGGSVSHELGWRWIFWVLTFMVVPLWLIQLFFLPETLRSLVGNGSGYANPTPYQYWQKKGTQRMVRRQDEEKKVGGANNTITNQSTMSLYSSVTACNDKEECMKISVDPSSTETIPTNNNQHVQKETAKPPKSRFLTLPNPFQSLNFLKEKDVFVVLLYNSLQYAGLYCVIISVTEMFIGIYGINELQIGLCFLSNGVGASTGSFISGRVLNWRFKKIARSLGIDEKATNRNNIPQDFPLEQARMGITAIWGIVFNVAMVAYGWSLQYKVHMAIPIILNFILSFCSTATFTSTNTLLIDLFPNNSAAIVASNNLTRCLLGAGAILIVHPGVQLMGMGWFFTAVSFFLLISRLTMVVELKYGPKWRIERRERQAKAV